VCYINSTFNALRTRVCKRLSLLAINSYLSWCGKRKRRHFPPYFFPHSQIFPFHSFFWKMFVKHWICERIKLCFVKQLSGIIYGLLEPTLKASLRNCLQSLPGGSGHVFMNFT